MTSPTLRLLPELEASLRQLTGVRAIRVVTGPDRKPVEIHVLAARDKAPKQVVRDVQTLAMAEFDLEIDHRIISVVQLDDGDDAVTVADGSAAPATPASVNRVTISAISVESAGVYAQVGVTLAAAGLSATGTSRGPAGAGHRLRIVARATLDGVAQLVELDAAEVDHAQVVRLGSSEVAVCTLHFVTQRGEHVVSGSAVVRNDPADAAARAVLDALNRRLPA